MVFNLLLALQKGGAKVRLLVPQYNVVLGETSRKKE